MCAGGGQELIDHFGRKDLGHELPEFLAAEELGEIVAETLRTADNERKPLGQQCAGRYWRGPVCAVEEGGIIGELADC